MRTPEQKAKRIRTPAQKERAKYLYSLRREELLKRMKKWNIENRVQKKEYNRVYHSTHKRTYTPEQRERANAQQRESRLRHLEEIRARDRARGKFRIIDKAKSRASSRKYYYTHQEKRLADRKRDKEKMVIYSREYSRNPERRAYMAEKYKSDIEYRLKTLLRTRLWKLAKDKAYKKEESSTKLIGCSVAELKVHLEGLFQEGMTWSNHSLHGWHIDHRTPVSAFDLSDIEQQKEAFHYTNLQPLWAFDNLSKHNKILV